MPRQAASSGHPIGGLCTRRTPIRQGSCRNCRSAEGGPKSERFTFTRQAASAIVAGLQLPGTDWSGPSDPGHNIHFGTEAVVSTKSSASHLDVQIRWLIRRDMPEVLSIEQQSFEFSWTEEDFLCCLRQRNCIGMVAERDHEIVGFMIYELHKSRLNILNFAVAPKQRRQGVGSQMVMRLVDKLSQQRRKEILLEVRERNLNAQMFFKQQAFRAVRVLRSHYDDTCEDAYIMQFRLNASEEALSFTPTNRISEFGAA
jgi:[ribosomal protein S18]-alanine N-acetyltransferase